MNTIAIIPARGGSKAIPAKNLVPFCGKPLLTWTIECALACHSVDEVYVSTDDDRITSVSAESGAGVIRRPAEIAGDTSTSEQAILHALDEIESKSPVDLVVFLQATSPVREPSDIDGAVEVFLAEKADTLFSGSIIENLCVWQMGPRGLDSITFDYRDRKLRQDRKPYYLENGSIFVFRTDFVRRHNNRLGGVIAFYPMPLWKSYEIDTFDDLQVCEYYMLRNILAGKPPEVSFTGVKLIVYDFDGVFTDNRVIVNQEGVESVTANRADGLAVGLIADKGVEQIILTTETNPVTESRARKIGLPIIRGVSDKKAVLADYCRSRSVDQADVIYIGNDLNDLEAMKTVGHPVCPADACAEVKAVCKLVLDVCGGAGVARRLYDYL